jgi:hypothetical protein
MTPPPMWCFPMGANRRGSKHGQLIYDWLVGQIRNDKERLITRLSLALDHRPNGCILYKRTGGKTVEGYYRVSVMMSGRRLKFYAHHVFFTLCNRHPIAVGMEIDHICGARNCVNPAHLREVSPQENLRHRDDRRNGCPF